MNKDASKVEFSPMELLLLAGGLLTFLFLGLRTISGTEIFFHLASGRFALANGAATIDPFSFGLSPGTAWIQTSWLYDIFMVKLWQLGGATFISLIHVFAVVGAFLLLLPVSGKYCRPLHQAMALMMCAWIFAPLYTLRPMLFCLLFVGSYLNILSRPRLTITTGILLLLIQLVWANMHESFSAGLFLVAMKGLEAFVRRRERTSDETAFPVYIGLLGIMLIIGLINPAGINLYTSTLTNLLRPESGVVLEWASPFVRDFLPSQLGHLTTIMLVLIASVFVIRREKLPIMLTSAAVLSAYLIVKSTRNVDLCALLAYPFVCISIGGFATLIHAKSGDPHRRLIRQALIGAFAAIWLFSTWVIFTNRYYVYTGNASAFGLGINQDVMPAAAANFLGQREIRPERILNIAHDGGYLLWRLPQDKVFTDPRGHLYGGAFFGNLARGLMGHQEIWNLLMEKYDFDAILLNASWTGAGTMAYHLLSGEQWSMVYFDGTSLLLARRTSANSALLDNEDMQKFGLDLIEKNYQRYRERLGNRIVRPPNPGRLIGAAAVFQALGRHKEALPILETLTVGSPRMSSAWVNRGIAESALGRYEQAIRTLEYTSRILPTHPLVWLWLGQNYKAVGRDADSARAFENAGKINPKFAERFQRDVTQQNLKLDQSDEP